MKNKFKETLKALIASKGVSARQVAKACDIPQSTLTSFLSGRIAQKPEQLLRLCRYFNVSMEYLLFGEDTQLQNLDKLLTEEVFSGWLKVKVERAIPGKGNKP